MTALAYLGAVALARRIRAGRLRASDALEAVLERQARLHPRINAVVVANVAAARRAARRIDRAIGRGERPGPLAGVPITVKESFDVAGLATTWGIERHRANLAARHAVVVERLLAAGAVLWGKSNVPVLLADWQTFNPLFGTTCNPWNVGRTPGGSSGGAAAALAAGLSYLEYGSDIGGSIRNPAHYCGVYGHKSTLGIVPALGHALPDMPLPTDMSVVGPLARSADDLALALRLTAGPAGADARGLRLALPAPTFRRLEDLRIAVVPDDPVAPVSRSVADAIRALAETLARRGARVRVGARLPCEAPALDRMYLLLRRAATSLRAHDDRSFARALDERATLDPQDRSYRAEQLRGNTMTHRDWLALANARERVRAGCEAFFRDHDLLLCPCAAGTAFAHNQQGARWERTIDVDGTTQPDTLQAFWMALASVAGLPATQAPIAIAGDGLPVGVQIIGPRYADRSTIRFARLLEREVFAFVPPPGLDP